MRAWVAVVACFALTGCDTGGTASIVLDIPNAMLDPVGFSTVEVRLVTPDGASDQRTAPVVDGRFDLGLLDLPAEFSTGFTIEAALRAEEGAVVGYGRVAAPVTLALDDRVVIPVRRPIVYLAGLINIDQDGNAATTNDVTWLTSPPTFLDLATNAAADGTAKLADETVLAVSAGPRLFTLEQMPSSPTGVLSGPPSLREVSTGDHSSIGSINATMEGSVADAAGSDDGRLLVVATSRHLYVVTVDTGRSRPVADGDFERVAIVSTGDDALVAVAIRGRARVASCAAEVVWVAVNADDTSQLSTVATGGFTDVAADGGRAFVVDSCNRGELGELSASGLRTLRSGLGVPGALAVANGQAWIGLQPPGRASLMSVPLDPGAASRTLFDEEVSQVIELTREPSVQRRLQATSVEFRHLEVGAGGDYVAATIVATYEAPRVFDAFPRVTWESEELRVIQTSTGAAVQRYRSWCDGVQYIEFIDDIFPWRCATTPGLSTPTNIDLEHRLHSMTFLFGRK